ncbi:hypothetical protein GCM10010211_73720 [Streptomyces albospinus]|uniref:Uncharacterized protein n=1 Tax=Streptomyces albospinus TaxID=285515 RepID=A0ABQ2VNP9_9ACTN|nr:hypothetical protein GCM10010211_73720 [Streptomyces albospinus]
MGTAVVRWKNSTNSVALAAKNAVVTDSDITRHAEGNLVRLASGASRRIPVGRGHVVHQRRAVRHVFRGGVPEPGLFSRAADSTPPPSTGLFIAESAKGSQITLSRRRQRRDES